jgi:DNA replication protein DnaC
MICPVCKEQELTQNRQVCRECQKNQRWEEIKFKEAIEIFSPRIVKELRNHWDDIKLQPNDCKVNQGLYLYGPRGCGKTLYSARLLMELKRLSFLSYHSPYIQGLFIHTLNLLEELKNSFGPNPEKTSQELIELYSEADVLILDDLGTQKTTDWAFQTLYLILNNRYENLKTTIITSNLSLDELWDNLLGDDRIPSRIQEMCRIKETVGEDYRGR